MSETARVQKQDINLSNDCPHDKVEIIFKGMTPDGISESITIRCKQCWLPIFQWNSIRGKGQVLSAMGFKKVEI